MNNYVNNGIKWLVNGGLTDALSEIFNTIHRDDQYEMVRNGHFGRVLKYTNSYESYYIKHYKAKGGIDRFKSLFAQSKAKREWNQGFLLLKNGFHTAEPVAMGETRSCGILRDCYIISKTIPNSISVKALLLELIKTPAGVIQKKEVLRNLILFVKNMHDAGILHGDLHAENILVDVNDFALFYLIDIGHARFGKKTTLSARKKELSRLLYSIEDVCTNEEIIELACCYGTFDPQEILGSVGATKYRIWRSRAGKCLKKNNVFTIIKKGGYRINMRAEWDADTLLALIEKHNDSLRDRQENVIKNSHKTGITLVLCPHEKIKGVCVKEYRYPALLKRGVYSLIHSPARKAWLASHGLLALKLLTPQPIALCESRKYGILEKSFLVTEDATGNLPCNQYVTEKLNRAHGELVFRKKRRFVSSLAESFRKLHDLGVYHADLKANNILVNELPDAWNFYYLDLDRVYFNRRITRDERIRNLSQINASMPDCITYTDRLRFYRAYMKGKKINNADKEIILGIIKASIARKHLWQPQAKVLK